MRHRITSQLLSWGTGTVLGAGLAVSASAQTTGAVDSSGGLQEIVVTANKLNAQSGCTTCTASRSCAARKAHCTARAR